MDVRISQSDLTTLAALLTMKPPEAGIDASALVTMLGFAAAVWAVVPNTARLKLRLSMTWVDWSILFVAVLAIHILFFEEPLRAVGLYHSFGPWQWGFDKAVTQYLLFLFPVVWIGIRSRRTKLNRRRLPLLQKLSVELLNGRRFEELAALLDHHLATVLDIANDQTTEAPRVSRRPVGLSQTDTV